MTEGTYRLILLRHGESEWNAKNLFTGWVDVDLTEKGRAEAERGGHLMTERGVLPDVIHTSVLRRAIRTTEIALHAADRHWTPVRRHWRLNERHYGDLQLLKIIIMIIIIIIIIIYPSLLIIFFSIAKTFLLLPSLPFSSLLPSPLLLLLLLLLLRLLLLLPFLPCLRCAR